MKMNRIVIVGNGFDLAHGLKSSYEHFVVGYLNSIIEKAKSPADYDDGLVKLVVKEPLEDPTPIKHPEEISRFRMDLLQGGRYNRIVLSDYFTKLIAVPFNNWVDIEIYYYKQLVLLWQKYQRYAEPKSPLKHELQTLNSFFRNIKRALSDYLMKQETLASRKSAGLQSVLSDLIEFNPPFQVCFLNYNYSNILSKYVNFASHDYIHHNQIHGRLKEKVCDIIFGYGDLDDPIFHEFEKSGINEFLHHVKHFEYTATSNYRDLIGLLDAHKFEVVILGHSCGLSDKLSLSSIFTHDNCKSIRYYYYDKGNGENDYYEKVYAIGRLLPMSHKHILPKVMVPFSESQPLVKAK